MDDQIKDMMYVLGGIVLIAVVGLVGITWTELGELLVD